LLQYSIVTPLNSLRETHNASVLLFNDRKFISPPITILQISISKSKHIDTIQKPFQYLLITVTVLLSVVRPYMYTPWAYHVVGILWSVGMYCKCYRSQTKRCPCQASSGIYMESRSNCLGCTTAFHIYKYYDG